MNEMQKKKLKSALLISIVGLILSAISGLVSSNFSIYMIRLEVNAIIPFGISVGWAAYYIIKKNIKPFGDLFLKLKIAMITGLLFIALFILFSLILGTDPLLIFRKYK